jgi:SAM-dependent methyltransferase
MAARLLADVVATAWAPLRPNPSEKTFLGLGYTLPLLEPDWLQDTPQHRIIHGIPQRFAATTQAQPDCARHENNGDKGNVFLFNGQSLPFADRSVDCVCLLHGLENSPHPRRFLRDIWRILKDDGTLLTICANRRGIWARGEDTPFSLGQPYSMKQLQDILDHCLFNISHLQGGLFIPPISSDAVLAWAPAWERIGTRWLNRFGGVLIAYGCKKIYNTSFQGEGVKARTYVTAHNAMISKSSSEKYHRNGP